MCTLTVLRLGLVKTVKLMFNDPLMATPNLVRGARDVAPYTHSESYAVDALHTVSCDSLMGLVLRDFIDIHGY